MGVGMEPRVSLLLQEGQCLIDESNFGVMYLANREHTRLKHKGSGVGSGDEPSSVG
jgi:hypothetical protein